MQLALLAQHTPNATLKHLLHHHPRGMAQVATFPARFRPALSTLFRNALDGLWTPVSDLWAGAGGDSSVRGAELDDEDRALLLTLLEKEDVLCMKHSNRADQTKIAP